ncbi:MAG: hypothetical protein IPG12_15770 [Saprospiraceae bacterium]|nr:hypothetical protein [Saprospiraceae bacterium]
MAKYRIFDRFGFNLSKTEKITKTLPQFLEDYQEWFFNPKESDWKCSYQDQLLTKFQAPPELVSLLNFNIDTTLE